MLRWDPNPDLFIIPILNWPIKWYGLLFAFGFAIGFPIFKNTLVRYFQQTDQFQKSDEASLKRIALQITDKITFYMVVATVIGARLGHFLFYEKPASYLKHPMELLRFHEGGLASHGAAIAIILALWIFSHWSKKIEKGLTLVRLLDFVCIPTAFAGACIRFGNFINQEILGTPTTLPWGVIFGHPADGSLPVPRHPAQLYECFFYFLAFFLLWGLSFKSSWLLAKGRLIGLFLILIFGFRFAIEYFKIEQSHLLSSAAELTMGQWLSVPLFVLGFLLLIFARKSHLHK